jgi:uncharacterized BrkB/YihY/UPF0761 family membrane protein
MRRRNLISAVISILSLIGLLALMLFISLSAVMSGLDMVDRLVFGGLNIVVWLAISFLAVPVVIFAIITIIWLTMETRRATRDPHRRRWFSRSRDTTSSDHHPQHEPAISSYTSLDDWESK